VLITFDSGGLIARRIQNDESADVVMVARAEIESLEQAGRVMEGTAAELAKAVMGVAVRRGAPKPDISSVEAFKRTLLSAKSIARANPAADDVAAAQPHRCAISRCRSIRISSGLVGAPSMFLLIKLEPSLIVPLAVRRKGIARSAVLHLDCARFAWEAVVIGSRGRLFFPVRTAANAQIRERYSLKDPPPLHFASVFESVHARTFPMRTHAIEFTTG
jgi:hypothetical protein